MTLSMSLPGLLSLLGAFLLVFWLPGYLWARCLGCPGGPADPRTFTLSCLIGMAGVTLFVNDLSMALGFSLGTILGAAAVAAGTALAMGALSTPEKPVGRTSDANAIGPAPWIAALLVSGLILFAQLIVIHGERAYFPEEIRDYFIRIETIQAILKTGVPPRNTFAAVSSPQPWLATHYLYHLASAILAKVSGRPALEAYPFVTGLTSALFVLTCFMYVRRSASNRGAAVLFLILLFSEGLHFVMPLAKRIYEWDLATLFHIDYWAGSPGIPTWTRVLAWGAHHALAFAISLLTMDLILDGRRAHAVAAALCLGYLGGSSIFISAVFGITLAAYFLRALYLRRWSESMRLAATGTLALILAGPLILHLARGASDGGLALGIRTVGNSWSGAIVSAFFGYNRYTRVLDVPFHFLVMLGLPLVLAVFGARMARRSLPSDRTDLLLIYGAVSLFFALFVYSGSDSMMSIGVLPFKFVVAFLAAIWLQGIFSARSGASSLLKGTVIAAIVLHFAATPYDLYVDTFGRFLGYRRDEAKKQYVEIQVLEDMERRVTAPSYRVQVFPPWQNQDNYGLSNRVPIFAPRAQSLFLGDVAVGYGADRKAMDAYLSLVCAVYGKERETIRDRLAGFRYEEAPRGSAWHVYLSIARDCFQPPGQVSEEALKNLVREFQVFHWLIEPQDAGMREAATSMAQRGIVRILSRRNDYLLVDASPLAVYTEN